jgi:hypothetical protein
MVSCLVPKFLKLQNTRKSLLSEKACLINTSEYMKILEKQMLVNFKTAWDLRAGLVGSIIGNK